jgi:hypothetical protein
MAEDTLPSPTKAWHRPVRLILNILSGMLGTLFIVMGLLGAYSALNQNEIASALRLGIGMSAVGALLLFVAVRAYRRSHGFRLWKEDLSASGWFYVRGSIILGIIAILGTPLCLMVAWVIFALCCAPPPLP